MTWTVSFTQDTEVKGLGTLRASYDNGTVQASYSERTDTNGDFGAFVAACEAALLKVQGNRTDMAAISAKIELVLNGGP